MKWLLLVLLALWLISLVRVGAFIRFEGGALLISVLFGPFRVQVFPAKAPTPPKPSPKKKKKREGKEGGKKRAAFPDDGDRIQLLMRLIRLAGSAARRLRDKLTIDEVELYVVWGADDPADAAIAHGYASAAVGMIWPVLENHFNIAQRRIGTAVDFNRTTPEVTAQAVFYLTIGQGAALTCALLAQLLREYLAYRREKRKKGGPSWKKTIRSKT